ncbi:MAG: SDR family NAD(P)-dependent oxidoreductase [Thermoanaerobaculia bacterium]
MNDRCLADKNALIYGAGGAIGGAVARAFARHGARIFLAGRTVTKLDAVASDIAAAGGGAETAQVDTLDERAVNEHADRVAATAGRIDITLNAVGIPHVQGTPFLDLALDDYALPIHAYTRTNFITAKAAARHMAENSAGVILTISTPGSWLPGSGYLGYGVTCGAVETFSRLLASELGPSGIRVVCIRPHAIPEAAARGSHSHEVFRPVAEAAGVTVEQMLEQAAGGTLLRRLPTLDEVANAAVFLASDGASAMTAVIANLSCGALVD